MSLEHTWIIIELVISKVYVIWTIVYQFLSILILMATNIVVLWAYCILKLAG